MACARPGRPRPTSRAPPGGRRAHRPAPRARPGHRDRGRRHRRCGGGGGARAGPAPGRDRARRLGRRRLGALAAGRHGAGRRSVPGWRVTVRCEGARADVLDALVRSEAPWLRAGPSELAEAVELCALPAVTAVPSVLVGDLESAAAAAAAGAGVLVLVGGWDDAALGRLREALWPRVLVERVALPPGLEVDLA